MNTAATNNPATAAVGQEGPNRLGELRRRLRLGREREACAIVVDVAAHLDVFVQSFGLIRKAFESAERTHLLLNTLLQLDPHRLRHLAVIANVLALAECSDLREFVPSVVATLERRGCLDRVSIRRSDYLVQYLKYGAVVIDVLKRCKYGDSASSLQFWQAVEGILPRLIIPDALCRNLYRVSSWDAGGEDAWRRRLSTAFAVDHVARDWKFLSKNAAQKQSLLEAATDVEELKQFFLKLNCTKGLLLLTFHSGFVLAAQMMCGRYGNNSMGLGLLKTGKEGPGAREDPAGALFRAMKHLTGGGTLLIAPDGRQGTNYSIVRVLGGQYRVGHGAPFLAFETGCETGWYTAGLRNNRIVPIFVAGPTRKEGERFAEFRDRLLDFYACQISAHLAGDPGNLALNSYWLDYFKNAPKS